MITTPSDDPLTRKVRSLPGVTDARAELLERLGILTIRDLLFHFPSRYEEFTGLTPIAELVEGTIASVRGEVVEIDDKETSTGKRMVSVVLSDGGPGGLEAVWFNQPWITRRLRYGQQVVFTGKVKWFRDHWQMSMPEFQPADKADLAEGAGVVPVYPLTEDLRLAQLRQIIRRAVDEYAQHLVDILPESLRSKRRLPAVQQALRDIHFPANLETAENARRRFVYEEFLLLQLALALRRRELRDRQRAPKIHVTPAIDERIRRLFPFTLTGDQDKAIADIVEDLASDRPMQRLLQADVGAGKTAVAVYALLATVANKYQAVLMAPTEVLARQHWHTLEGYLAHSRVRRLLLTGALTPKQRRIALAEIAAGQVDLVIGTQALVQEGVEFARLGLVVIDEQHKFGVNQRARVRRLGIDPHYLVMTATPIPRTLALTVFGDLDVSIIRELPPGRQPVRTKWVLEKDRPRVYEELAAELKKGRQAYVVCPLVEESETLDLKAAEKVFAELRSGPPLNPPPGQGGDKGRVRVGLIHGRLEERDKDQIMQMFRDRQLDVLVSTVVIEVGVDVPNATLMVIEHADRFGLSQLHQLRGRISRGEVAGQCWLISGTVTDEARDRLKVLTRTTNGFAIAEEDVRLRGLGEFFGTRQHGLSEIRVGNLVRDNSILQEARRDAFQMVAADAGLRQAEHTLLREAVLRLYGDTLELAEVG